MRVERKHAKMEEEKNNDLAEETQTETEKAEPIQEQPDQSDLIMEIKHGYEEEIAKLRNDYQSKLEERERLIKQILKDGEPKQIKSVADEINERRKNLFTKW